MAESTTDALVSNPAGHVSAGLLGYVSMRCSYGYDGCEDLACVCSCHKMPEAEWQRYISEPHDSIHTMIPMSGNALRRTCGKCQHEIEPFEAYHKGKDTGVLWCDSCYTEDLNAE